MEIKDVSVEKSNGRKLKILVPVILSIAAIIVVVVVCTIKGGSVKIDDYITDTIQFSGYDGYGIVATTNNALIDYDQLYTDLGINSNLATAFGSAALLEQYIDITSDSENTKNLKNGDIVTYTIKINYDAINNLDGKKKLNGKEVVNKTFTVSDLKKAAEINPFDAIEKVIVSESYSGYNVDLQFYNKIGNYDIELTNPITKSYSFSTNEGKTITVSFSIPAIDKIKSGDKLTISLDKKMDECAAEGIVFSKVSQEFSVVTTKALTSGKKLTKTSYDKLKILFEEAAQSSSDGEYTFVDMYFYREKYDFNEEATSIIYALYKYKRDAVGSKTEYLTFSLDSPEIDSDGEIVIVSASINTPNSFMNTSYDSIGEFEKETKKGGYGAKVLDFEKIVA